jgi:hypothetical protein
LVYGLDPRERAVDSTSITDAILRRVDPGGWTRESTVRIASERTVEVIIAASDDEVEDVKAFLEAAGTMEFRILADHRMNPTLGEDALELSAYQKEFPSDAVGRDDVEGRWLPLAPEAIRSFYTATDEDPEGPVPGFRAVPFLRVLRDGQIVRPRPSLAEVLERKDIVEILLVIDPFHVTGDDLDAVASSVDERGNPAVGFKLNEDGAARFAQLTERHLPRGNFKYHLAIVLDDVVTSAPTVESVISAHGMITGYQGNEEGHRERDRVIAVLRSGRLPVKLSKSPLAESRIEPALAGPGRRLALLGCLTGAALVVAALYATFRRVGVAAASALGLQVLLTAGVVCAVRVVVNGPLAWGFAGSVFLVLLGLACMCEGMRRLGRQRDPLAAVHCVWRRAALPALVVGLAAVAAGWGLAGSLSAGWGASCGIGAAVGLLVLLLAFPTILECVACLGRPARPGDETPT